MVALIPPSFVLELQRVESKERDATITTEREQTYQALSQLLLAQRVSEARSLGEFGKLGISAEGEMSL